MKEKDKEHLAQTTEQALLRAEDVEFQRNQSLNGFDKYYYMDKVSQLEQEIKELKEFIKFAYQRRDLRHGNTCTLLREQRSDACSCGLAKALKQ